MGAIISSLESLGELLAALEVRIAPPAMRILVVEDDVSMLVRLSQALVVLGHTVDSFVGIEGVEGCSGWGQTASGDKLKVDLCAYDATFLDHFFASRDCNGSLLTMALRRCGDARILGMSSDAVANARMSSLGATVTIRKRTLRLLLD